MRPALVFDSGVGGLSVLAHLRALMPALPVLYAADTAAFPYGTKTEAELVARVGAVVGALAARHDPCCVVVACNTASTVALPALRHRLSVPVVGTVPAVKTAGEQSRSRVFGLLGTPGTVRRAYTQDLIDRFAADCTVIRVGSEDLVHLAEAKLRGQAVDPARLGAILLPFFAGAEGERLDAVVLACTHFPLMHPELDAVVPRPVRWIDSGAAIARRVLSLLGPCSGPARPFSALFTAPPDPALCRALAGRGCAGVEVVTG